MGVVVLFMGLCRGIVKLGEVESVGSGLRNNIGLVFVRGGI
nr:hypothetical protein [Staphylococcus epidermidis]